MARDQPPPTSRRRQSPAHIRSNLTRWIILMLRISPIQILLSPPLAFQSTAGRAKVFSCGHNRPLKCCSQDHHPCELPPELAGPCGKKEVWGCPFPRTHNPILTSAPGPPGFAQNVGISICCEPRPSHCHCPMPATALSLFPMRRRRRRLHGAY